MHILFEHNAEAPLTLWQVRQVFEGGLALLYGQNHGIEFAPVASGPRAVVVKTDRWQEVVCAAMTVRLHPSNGKNFMVRLVEFKQGPLFLPV